VVECLLSKNEALSANLLPLKVDKKNFQKQIFSSRHILHSSVDRAALSQSWVFISYVKIIVFPCPSFCENLSPQKQMVPKRLGKSECA
jgi:hypothetical protein